MPLHLEGALLRNIVIFFSYVVSPHIFVYISLIFVTDADQNELENNLQGLKVEVLLCRMIPRGDH